MNLQAAANAADPKTIDPRITRSSDVCLHTSRWHHRHMYVYGLMFVCMYDQCLQTYVTTSSGPRIDCFGDGGIGCTQLFDSFKGPFFCPPVL